MKHIVVVGGSGGIGSAFINQCLAEQPDLNISLIGRRSLPLTVENAQLIEYRCDLNHSGQVSAVAAKCRSLSDVDAIVSLAGVGHFQTCEALSEAQFTECLHVNFLSQAMLIRALVPGFKKRQSGRVIVVGSEAALQGKKFSCAYSASKFAMRGFCQALRDECRNHQVSVSQIHPGLTYTDFYDQQWFSPADGEGAALQAEHVANFIYQILTQPAMLVAEECVCQPMSAQVSRKPLKKRSEQTIAQTD